MSIPPLPPPLPCRSAAPIPTATAYAPPTDGLPLPYASPYYASVPPRPKLFSLGVFLWSEAIMFVAAVIAIFVLPRFQEVFQDFKVELPATTRALFALGTVVRWGGWVILLGFPVLLGFIFGTMGPTARRFGRMLITLIFAGFVVLIVLAIAQPFMTLMEGMSGKR